MGLYSPPPGDENHNKNKYHPNNNDDNNDDTSITKLYYRPSIGLRLWGPLVPASDCNWGLWLLTGTQVTIGYYFLRKFRISMKNYFMNKPITKQIKDIPSLNRFSNESQGTIQYMKTNHAGGNLINSKTGQLGMGNFGGTQSFHMQRQYTKWEILMGRYKKSKAFKYVENLKRVIFLLLGTTLTSLSLLEATRLLMFDYDPWAEQAKIARDQKFYNDASKFYREGVDPSKTRIRVKDQGTGKLVDVTNDDSLKRNIALARAGLLQNDWIFEWFGPLDLKPLTYSEFLSHIEQYEINKAALIESRNKEPAVHLLRNEMKNCKNMEMSLFDQNKKNRDLMMGLVESNANIGNFNANSPLNDVASQLSSLSGNSIKDINQSLGDHVNSMNKSNVVILPPNARSEDQMSIIDTWEANEPWTALGLSLDVTVKVVPYSRNELMKENDEKE